MSKNHGELKPVPRPKEKKPFLPRMLQRGLTTYSDYDRNVLANGLFEVKALVPLEIRGVQLAIGDKVKLPGNEVKTRVLDWEVEITDERAVKEAQVLQEVEKLGLNQPAQPSPENFAQPKRQRESWVKGVAA